MNLDEAQRKTVAGWIAEGLKLSDIQSRLASELGLRLTYMQVRLLVDDLKLTPKDQEPTKPAAELGKSPAGSPSKAAKKIETSTELDEETETLPGQVSVTLDQITRPGAMASGKVTFSDGKTGQWYLDSAGRLGLVPPNPGYRPSADDVQEFQVALEQALGGAGM